MEELARKLKPKMIIAGYTSYPWMPDWARFRQIADAVGAYLLADISHIAGMVAAGVVPSPVGHAHVTSFTTHKTLYGPRGACILTTDKKLAAKIDSAVFPGEQGGPHVNAIAGMAVAFQIARLPEFRKLQQQVIDNAAHLAAALGGGLRIPTAHRHPHAAGGLQGVRAKQGVSPDGVAGTPSWAGGAASWTWPGLCSTATPSRRWAPPTPAAFAWAPLDRSAALAERIEDLTGIWHGC